jgi:hypothetical protein
LCWKAAIYRHESAGNQPIFASLSMALAFEQLKKPIARELAEFEGRFRE